MSRMSELDRRLGDLDSITELTAQGINQVNERLDRFCQLVDDVRQIDHRLDRLLHLMSDLAKMESTIVKRIDSLELSAPSINKLVDRLIELSMVIKGDTVAAVTHRGQARLDTPQPPEDKEPEPDEDDWAPKGCDVMEMLG